MHVNWVSALVAKLLPSTIKRFATSWTRWYLSTTEFLRAFPMQQVPIRCPAEATIRYRRGPLLSCASGVEQFHECSLKM